MRVHPRALEKLPGLAQSSRGKKKALPAVAEPDTDMIGSVEIVEEITQPSSVLIDFRIANVPATTRELDSTYTVNADWISLEIYRKTRQLLIQV